MDIQTSELTHFSDAWRARMVDVSEPPPSIPRVMIVSGSCACRRKHYRESRPGRIDKGDVLTVANVGATDLGSVTTTGTFQ